MEMFKRSKGLLAQYAVFSLRQLVIFSRCKDYDTRSLNNVQNNVRNISPLDKNACALSDLGLNQCLLVVKARLKPAYN